MFGAFASRNKGKQFAVVVAKCTIRDSSGSLFVAVAHDVLYDKNSLQKESLLSIHQSLKCQQNAIDDRSKFERDINENFGTQSSRFGDHTLPFFFDGRKCYYELIKFDETQHCSLPHIVISDKGSGKHEHRIHSRMTRSEESAHIALWQKRFGMFLPLDVVRKRLNVTTHQWRHVRSCVIISKHVSHN